MAEWELEYSLDGLDKDFIAIRSLFVSGHIKKMKQLEEQSPTKIATLLGLNYDSYRNKLKTQAYLRCTTSTYLHTLVKSTRILFTI